MIESWSNAYIVPSIYSKVCYRWQKKLIYLWCCSSSSDQKVMIAHDIPMKSYKIPWNQYFPWYFPRKCPPESSRFFSPLWRPRETAVSTAAVPEAEAPQPMGLVNCHIAIENPPFFMGKSPFLMGKHHFFNGKTHYFDWAIFNSELLVYQRVYIYIWSKNLWESIIYMEIMV